MPFAANGRISTDEFPDSIEISAEQYQEALEGMCNGLVVTIEHGFKVALVDAPASTLDPVPTPEPTLDELLEMANARRDRLLAIAAIRIAPLQDAVDLGEVTPPETALLNDWKRYRVALNRLPDQPGFPTEIDWPLPPA
ncbi:tail fiber assembly protein [Pseudomonas sp. MWU13-3659]|uniref:tail fiber assembly protein n=1 Tax=Pseudomonas sp. MWU13-3659 TaxID=2986964 RepID=UPI0020753AE6|nr:tail fiber assembly protein [Pseudomonas sp. MWU13-3659]